VAGELGRVPAVGGDEARRHQRLHQKRVLAVGGGQPPLAVLGRRAHLVQLVLAQTLGPEAVSAQAEAGEDERDQSGGDEQASRRALGGARRGFACDFGRRDCGGGGGQNPVNLPTKTRRARGGDRTPALKRKKG
jgi:hypothetical protein